MMETIGWIVEARIKKGKRAAFRAVAAELAAETRRAAGTLDYRYYLSDSGELLVFKRFRDVAAAHAHVEIWSRHARAWMATVENPRTLRSGELPALLRKCFTEIGALPDALHPAAA